MTTEAVAPTTLEARSLSALFLLVATVGFLVLDQGLSPQTIVAIVLVVIASIVAARSEPLPEPA